MTVNVRIFGGLQRHVNGLSETRLDISPATEAWDVLEALGIPEEEVWFVAVNGVRVPREHVLESEDKVDIFAPVGGG